MALVQIRDKFTGKIIESHDVDGSLLAWMREAVPTYQHMDRPPYTAKLNGDPWPHSAHDRPLSPTDYVEINIEPRDPATIIFAVVTVLSAAYAYNAMSNLPNVQDSSAAAGNSIYSPSARGNSVLPDGIIRETCGSMTIYPDVIGEYRNYNDHEEELFLMLCLGRGHFLASEQNVYVSESRLIDQGDAEINFYEPGQSVVGDAAAENWYTSREIDGVELTTDTGEVVGNWSIDVDIAQFTAYLDGSDQGGFPFAVNEFFEITSSPGDAYNGYYRVISLSGLYQNIAAVQSYSRANGDTGRLEIESNSAPVFSASTRPTNVWSAAEAGKANRQARTTTRRIMITPVTPSFSTGTGAPITWTGINGGVRWFGDYKAAPAGQVSQYYSFDVLFNRGLANVDDDGDEINATVEIEVQYRDINDAVWSTVPSTTFTDASYDARAYTVFVDAGSPIEAVFRFRRVTKDSDNVNLSDRVSISRLKVKLPAPTSYADETVMTVKILGGEALSRAAENQINLRGHVRKLPTIAELEAGSWDLSNAATSISGDWTVSGASSVSIFGVLSSLPPLSAPPNNFIGFDFAADGSSLMIADNDYLKDLVLTTPGRVDLGFDYRAYKVWTTLSGGFSLTPDSGSISFCMGGTRLFMVRQNSSFVSVVLGFSLSVAYNLTTASFISSLTMGAEIADYDGVTITAKSDGSKFWLNSRPNSIIVEYEMLTPGAPSTGGANGTTFDVSTLIGDIDADDGTNLKGIHFTDNNGSGEPTRAYLMREDGKIYGCTFGIPGDITTITASDEFDNYLPDGVSPQNIRVRQDYFYVSYMDGGEGFIQTIRPKALTDSRASRSPVRFAGLMLREALGDKADTKVNWSKMQEMETETANRGDTLDAEFVEETALWDAVKLMLAPALIEPSIKEGAFYPVKLKAGLDAAHMYTPDVMLNDGLEISSNFYDPVESDGIEVEYFDLDSNSNEVVNCFLPGDAGLRKKRIQLIGATSRTQAWRAGMRERRRQKFKPLGYRFDTEMDALNSDYGDVVLLASEVFASQFASVTAYSGSTVTLDTEPDLTAGTMYAAIRQPTGRMSGLYQVDGAGVAANQLNLVSPSTLDFTPILDDSGDPSFVAIGTIDQLARYAIIREINPGGDGQVSVTAEEYLESIYADDNNEPS